MDRPVLAVAGVAISGGKILEVASAGNLRDHYPGSPVEDLGEVVLLPGLVNAHTHLELSALTPGDRPLSFVHWLKQLFRQNPPPGQTMQAFVERGVEIGVRQCLQFGVTSVGDISRQCPITRPLLLARSEPAKPQAAQSGLGKPGPIRVVSYGEVLAMAARRGFLEERISIAADRSHETEHLRTALSPHAPYTVEAGGYRRCLETAGARGLPLATHLAETLDEATFLESHGGPFREIWEFLGAWDEQVPTFAGGPIRFAAAMGLLDYPTLLAHVNYCDDSELALLAAGRASVVYCPRTHAYFGHPPHRWRDMLAAGINVAVGTDSCASSPNLNLVDDLRLLHEIAPDVPALNLWEMATLRAARAIQWEDRIGSITPGKCADLVSFPVAGNDPLREILESQSLPARVWIARPGLKEILGEIRNPNPRNPNQIRNPKSE